MKNEEGRPSCQINPKNSMPVTLCSICGGKSPNSSAVPMKFEHKPINRIAPVASKLYILRIWNTTGASIKTTTTLSMNMEIKPDRPPIRVTNRGTLPLDRLSVISPRYSGIPVLPKYPASSQILTRMAMTFQSTKPNACSSVITPSITISTTPTMAATTLSIHRTTTMNTVATKMTRAIICIDSI